MKMKSFAMLAMSGMLASMVAYVTPAIADDYDLNNNNSNVQPISPDDTLQAYKNDANIGAMTNTAQNNKAPQQDYNNIVEDQGTADTATGDDDY